ncbi:MAG: methyl-accepting chemotaxis protein [Gemmatimonadales bacterium]
MIDPVLADSSSQAINRSRIRSGWPLVAAVGVLAIGVPLLPRLGAEPGYPAATITFVALALIAMGCANAALLKLPTDRATPPFVGLAAAAAVLLAVAPLDRAASGSNIVAFLLAAPWRYALPPLVVHFVLEAGWAQRRRRWLAWISGWYAIQLGVLLVATAGMAMNETPLVDAVDLTFRSLVAEPVAAVAAIAAILFALITPVRGRIQRVPLLWLLLAVVVGFVPLILAEFVPASATAVAVNPARLALVALPVFGLAALLTMPLRDDLARELLGHRLAADIYDGSDLAGALRRVAETIHETLGTRGVAVQMQRPDILATAGEASGAGSGALPAAGGYVEEDRADLAVTIGRSGDPLGEVRLIGRTVGAFSSIERDWLVGLLQPIGAALRVRRREVAVAAQQDAFTLQLRERYDDVRRGARHLPGQGTETETPPPPVDAREVLAQLTEGIGAVERHGGGLGLAAAEARDHARAGSDTVAQALDALAALAARVTELTNFNAEISASNATVSDVAFRINLVANNAALEATRAGTAGRTFGVLAEEVRRLADATASTSAEIGQRAASLAVDVADISAIIERVRQTLAAAIREAEAGEFATERLKQTAAAVEDAARALEPALAEANDVASRRSARDQHLTASVEQAFNQRTELGRALRLHYDAIERLGRALGQPRG